MGVPRTTVLALPAGEVPGVVWGAPIYDFSGVAGEARQFITGLRGAGARVRAVSMSAVDARLLSSLDPRLLDELRAAEQADLGPYPILVEHMACHALRPFDGVSRLVARTMAATASLPPQSVTVCNEFDELWVPTEFDVETFERSGVRVPIFVVPTGVDTDVFRPGAAPVTVPGTRGTVFLADFDLARGTGWDILLQAWARAFGPEDDVSLVLRSAGAPDTCVDAFLGAIGRSRATVAPVVCLPGPVATTAGLYAAAGAYVAPTRGARSGRRCLEAMACGLPVIATRWGPNPAFMDDDNSLPLDIYGLDDATDDGAPSSVAGQLWAMPSTDHLVELLQRVAGGPEAAVAIGRRAR